MERARLESGPFFMKFLLLYISLSSFLYASEKQVQIDPKIVGEAWDAMEIKDNRGRSIASPDLPEKIEEEIKQTENLKLTEVSLRSYMGYNTQLSFEGANHLYVLYLYKQDEALLKEDLYTLRNNFKTIQITYSEQKDKLCFKSLTLEKTKYELTSLSTKCGQLIRSIPKNEIKEKSYVVGNDFKVDSKSVTKYIKANPSQKQFLSVLKGKYLQMGMSQDLVDLIYGSSKILSHDFNGKGMKLVDYQGYSVGFNSKNQLVYFEEKTITQEDLQMGKQMIQHQKTQMQNQDKQLDNALKEIQRMENNIKGQK